MKLQRTYKKGTLVKFMWYNNYRDEGLNTSNFRVVEGLVEETDFFGDIIVYNGNENMSYCVPSNNIIESFKDEK